MKIVVVTGATKGLGFAIAERAIQEGYYVVAVGREKNDKLEQLLVKHQNSLGFEMFDFSNLDKIHEFSVSIQKKYGRVYGLVNNAALGYDGILATMHEKNISELIKVNVEAPILLSKYLLRPMLINRCGRIVNITSIIASTGFNGLAVYGASKAALAGFTLSLSREVGKANITVNNIAPGYMETAMTASLQGEKLESIKRRSPLSRLVKVEEVADGVIFLLSDKAASITGTTVTIDAGSTA